MDVCGSEREERREEKSLNTSTLHYKEISKRYIVRVTDFASNRILQLFRFVRLRQCVGRLLGQIVSVYIRS